MSLDVLVVGGGIGGLATALVLARSGHSVRLVEQAAEWGDDVGAGVQLGPNATRILAHWGLSGALEEAASAPRALRVLDGTTGAAIAQLELGALAFSRYGAPYLTIHRADLHAALRRAALAAGVLAQTGRRVARASQDGAGAVLHFEDTQGGDTGGEDSAPLVVGADGVWSRVRAGAARPLRAMSEFLFLRGTDGGGVAGAGTIPDPAFNEPARATGHLAHRALIDLSAVPRLAGDDARDVRVWLAPRAHVVAYPVRGGRQLNVAAFTEGGSARAQPNWDRPATSSDLLAAFGGACTEVRALVDAAPRWRLWSVYDRPPLVRASQMALGRIALVGDAAHPMRPYLAQGAAMAIEDAAALAAALVGVDASGVPAALARYADARWRRNARVQRRAARNGRVFHAAGPIRWARDAALGAFGARLLDLPWLYAARRID